MPKVQQDAATETAAAPDEFPLGLDEFCMQTSASDKRVELIAAFHVTEKAAGRLHGLPSEYRERFVAFASAPA